jgi:hypothetical protein
MMKMKTGIFKISFLVTCVPQQSLCLFYRWVFLAITEIHF